MFEISRETTFSASHQLLNYKGKCERLHGHNWRVRVTLRGRDLDASGMLVDFHVLDAWIRDVVERFDHRHLNDVAPFSTQGLSPSSERLARIVAEQIAEKLPPDGSVRVVRCDVWENDLSRAAFLPEDG